MHPVPFKPVDGVSLEITGLDEMKWDKDAKLVAVKLTHRNHLQLACCSPQMGAVHIGAPPVVVAKKHHDILSVIIAIKH